jgi:TolB-like protein/Tfp pilus assembly protein PilF
VTDAPIEREDVGAWARLRRRKVVQWGIAYAAGSWVLLQVLGFAADAFEWPAITKRLAMLALVLGLPVALVLAWYHGDKGEQRVTRSELAILTVLCLLGGGALWLYGQRSSQVQTNVATATPATVTTVGTSVADARPSIAVLPFENRSDQEKDAFFVDGIHDDILTQLSKVSALKVISRTSVDRFRKTDLSLQQIAQQLGVKSILEGGVQRAGDRVRINVQLIDAASDAHLWAESYDRELTAANIFAIQSEVAAAIAGALKATLTAGEQARVNAVPTQNLEAWGNYQLGRQRLAKRTSSGLTEAERYFRKAIELDPNFALAYSGLADSLAVSLDYTNAPRAATLERAQAAVDTALKLDPGLADAWASAGLIESQGGHRERAEEMFLRAIELNPNHAMARKWYGLALMDLGRFEESLAQLEQAARLDPLSVIVQRNLGQALEAQGRFRDAASHYQKAIEIDPSMPSSYMDLALLAAYAMNQYAVAVPLAEKAIALDPNIPISTVVVAWLYWELGDDASLDRMLRQAEDRWPDNTWVQSFLALRDMQGGDRNGAARRARRALEANPRDEFALWVLGVVDYREGRYAESVARYRKAFPEMFSAAPRIGASDFTTAIDMVPALQKLGKTDEALALLAGSEKVMAKLPLLGAGLGWGGRAPHDARALALRGRKQEALAALRAAEQAGWRSTWRFYRDVEPAFDSIRDDPEFKAIFADIERDMARQRGELAKRPKDAPLDLDPSR